MTTSKIKDAITKIVFKRSGVYDINDISIEFSLTDFDTNEYHVYYETFDVRQWSATKREIIKLTEVLFNLED